MDIKTEFFLVGSNFVHIDLIHTKVLPFEITFVRGDLEFLVSMVTKKS
jgi:hypothetical protein